MAFHNGNTLKMLGFIKERGAATSSELFNACGVASKNQPSLLSRYIDDGTLNTEIVKVPHGTGERAGKIRRYIWCGGERTVHAVIAAKPPSGPQARGMRRCLGPDCGRMFMSESAAHRLCPRCKAAAALSASRCGLFDTPHVVLNP